MNKVRLYLLLEKPPAHSQAEYVSLNGRLLDSTFMFRNFHFLHSVCMLRFLSSCASQKEERNRKRLSGCVSLSLSLSVPRSASSEKGVSACLLLKGREGSLHGGPSLLSLFLCCCSLVLIPLVVASGSGLCLLAFLCLSFSLPFLLFFFFTGVCLCVCVLTLPHPL